MADLKLAVQTAIVQALGAVTLPGSAPVWQDVPDDLQPPYVAIDRMETTPIGGKGGALDRISIDIASVVRAEGREFLTPLMTAVRAAIDGQSLPSQSGVAMSKPTFEGDEDDISEDGKTYVGFQTFTVIAQPA